MNDLNHLRWQIRINILGTLLSNIVLVSGVWYVCQTYFGMATILSAVLGMLAGVAHGYIAVGLLTDAALKPLESVWQAMLHVDPNHASVAAPNVDKLRFGRELITHMTLQIYQFAAKQDGKDLKEHREDVIQAASVVSHMPLPLFVFNKQLLVTNASDTALTYCAIESSDLFGKPIFDSVNLEFGSDNTLEKWIESVQTTKVTDTASWEHVRVITPDGSYRQCDLAAYYNRENSSGTEFIVTLFDRTEKYGQDDESLSFISLAVHELRTPLTMLRGYIEVLEDEVGPKLDPELQDFMRKMRASANQLTAFVHNVLNVARVENNQLILHLVEGNWHEVLKSGATAMELRAQIEKVEITYDIAPNLPAVAIDPVTIQEVINNLLDNAIKYSAGAKSKKILVSSKLNSDGLIETTVQDSGVGIPESVMPSLFTKFYRNHRTKGTVSGTGLGLYLCKAVIDAHEGKIWAKSKEGEGSTFGFTLLPYSQLAEEKRASGEIVRQANGWIKNHSYYRS